MAAMRGIEKNFIVISLAAVAMMLWVGAAGQSSSCANVVVGMAPCLTYITGSSSKPSSSCCQQLASVVQSQPQCLCQVLNGGSGVVAALGISINQTLALALPGACNVKTPPVSDCNAANGPSTSPATESPVGSPTASIVPEESPNGLDVGTGSNAKAEPSIGIDTSEGTKMITTSAFHLGGLLLVIMASYASTLTGF